jgi:nucleotide-binding universal stress UspA family protein
MAARAPAEETGRVILRHIIVAVDDDEVAPAALRAAADLARRTSARLTIAHVAPTVDEVVGRLAHALAALWSGWEIRRSRSSHTLHPDFA